MLIPTVPVKEFKKFGFKKCVGEYGKENFVEVDESWKAHFMRRFQDVK